MKSILGFLEEIENLAYKILLWIIFIPKTIVQITLNPSWVPGYVRGELKQEKSPFDEYMSPVILLLVVALIPALIYQYLPTFGVTVTKHVEKESARQDTIEYWISKNFPAPENTYDAEADFASLSTDMRLRFEWYVQEISSDEKGNSPEYQEIYREIHDEGDETIFIEHVDPNTAKDTFYFPFERPGKYYVNVTVTKYNPAKNNLPLERYDSYLYVYVPESNNPDLKGFISESSIQTKATSGRFDVSQIAGKFKEESNIFLVFGLLIPPLFFALATKLFSRKEISENALRETFYAECYYFSPISLAIWAAIYAARFLTNDVFYYYDASILIVFLPALLAIIWFIWVQTTAIIKEEKIVWWKALSIVLFCITVLLMVGGFIVSFAFLSIQDVIRKLGIWLYVLAAIALLTFLAISSIRNRRRENQRIPIGNTLSLGCLFLVIAATLGFVGLAGKTVPLDTSVQAVTQSVDSEQPVSLQDIPLATESPTATVIADTPTTEVQPSYTEEFAGDLKNWRRFTVSGQESQVEMGLREGSLVFRLTPHEDAIPAILLLNEAFSYSDVKVEAVTTNNGINANGVSLVCRFGETGWYEFTISNGGTYEIYAVDAAGVVKQGYNLLNNGGSAAIKAGHVTNTYTAVCQGHELTLYANGTELLTIQDTKFNFTDGLVGIGVSSPQNSPVSLQFDSVTVNEP